MPRTMSLAGLQSMIKQEVDELFMEILEINHAELGAPLRYVNDREDVTSNGDVYTAFPFNIHLPPDVEGKLPEVTLTITTVDQQIQSSLRSLTTSPTVDLSVIRKSTPNTLEVGPLVFTVQAITYNHMAMDISLGFDSHILGEAFPKDIFASYNSE